MRKLALSVCLLAFAVVPVEAQQGFGEVSFNAGAQLRGNYHINRSAVDTRSPQVPEDENGYGLGVEFIGNHLGMALYGFSSGEASEFDSETTSVVMVAEVNYFYPLEDLRLAPYVGIHSGLGVFTKDYFSDPYFPSPKDGLSKLGYQIGLRYKPIPLVGLDAQWRRMSDFTHRTQGRSLERNQILLGITLF